MPLAAIRRKGRDNRREIMMLAEENAKNTLAYLYRGVA